MPGSAAAERSKGNRELCDLANDHVHHGRHGNDPLPMFQRYSPWGTDCDQGQPVDPHHLSAFVPPRLVGEVVSFGVNKESYRYVSSSLILTKSCSGE